MAIYTFDKIAINSTQKVKPLESDKEHYIGLEHIDPECLYITRWGADAAPIGEKLVMKKGDILFGKRRAYQRKVGIAPFDGIFSAHGLVLRPKEDVIIKEFFPFFISSDQFLDRAVQISVGGLSPTVNWSDLARQEFELPSIEEQKVLADKLWAAYKVKESYRQLLSTTDDMLKAKFQEMFGDGKWEQKKWSDVLSVLNGKAYPAEYQESGTYPIYGSGGIMAYGEKKLCEGNTIIIGRKGNINNPIFVKDPYWAVDTAFSISVKPEFLVPIYMYFWCKNFDFNVYNKQGVLPSLTKSDLENIIMGIPPIDMQKEFASIYTQAEATKASLRASIEAIDRVIRSLINQ